MTASVRILSDDLTGALDSAAGFGGRGEVPVYLGRPGSVPRGIGVVATATRDVSPALLARQLGPCVDWLADADLSFKKVDSLVRGNTFHEVAWLARSGRFDRIVFAPAYPAQGRCTRHGRHTTRTDAPNGARSARASLLRALARVGLRAAAGATLAHCGSAAVMVPDVASDAALMRLAHWSTRREARHWLWCGSAGLARALARQHGMAPGGPLERAAFDSVLVVTASRHPALRSQLGHPALAGPGVHVADLSNRTPLPSTAARAELARRAAELVANMPRPGLVVVVGGDTLLALCHAAGVRRLSAMDAPFAGWGRARWIGGRWHGVQCLSRSGAFGAADDLGRVIDSFAVVS